MVVYPIEFCPWGCTLIRSIFVILKQADICSSFIRDFLTTSTACLLLFASDPDLYVGGKAGQVGHQYSDSFPAAGGDYHLKCFDIIGDNLISLTFLVDRKSAFLLRTIVEIKWKLNS